MFLKLQWYKGNNNFPKNIGKMTYKLIEYPYVCLISSSMDSDTGCTNINRENEVRHGMKENDVGDEQSQHAKWRR